MNRIRCSFLASTDTGQPSTRAHGVVAADSKNECRSLQFSSWSIIILSLVRRAALKSGYTIVANEVNGVEPANDTGGILRFRLLVPECPQIVATRGITSITVATALAEACHSPKTMCVLGNRATMAELVLELESVTSRKTFLTPRKNHVSHLQ